MSKEDDKLSPEAKYSRKRYSGMKTIKLWLTNEEIEQLDRLRGAEPRAAWVRRVIGSILLPGGNKADR